MKVLISGATGFLGSALAERLRAKGHDVWALSRRPGEKRIVWDLSASSLPPGALDGVDAIVHLAGENIAGRWTRRKMDAIRMSRVLGTRLLAEAAARAPVAPSVFVMASAVGIYGDRGDEELNESSAPGNGFLAQIGQEWEGAAKAAEDRPEIRVVKLRFGVVLAPDGGAVKKMLPAFQLGVGGHLGSGKQWMPWISREDAVQILYRAVTDSGMQGVYNAVAPVPVTNDEFTHELGRALRRPAVFPVPAWALRQLFGRMADEALLAGQRVIPAKLLAEGFGFRDPELGAALRGMF